MSDKGVCRTALATTGLLIMNTSAWSNQISFYSFDKRREYFEAILLGTNFRVIGYGLEKLLGSRLDSLFGMGPNGEVRYRPCRGGGERRHQYGQPVMPHSFNLVEESAPLCFVELDKIVLLPFPC